MPAKLDVYAAKLDVRLLNTGETTTLAAYIDEVAVLTDKIVVFVHNGFLNS